jgi:hypothetical protein
MIEVNFEPVGGDSIMRENKLNLPMGLPMGIRDSGGTGKERLFLEDFMGEESVYSFSESQVECDVERGKKRMLSRVEEVVEDGLERGTPRVEMGKAGFEEISQFSLFRDVKK